MTPTPTPRTDANMLHGNDRTGQLVGAGFARQLERELADATAELAYVKKDYHLLSSQLDGHDAAECSLNLGNLKRELAEAKSPIGRMFPTVAQDVNPSAFQLLDPHAIAEQRDDAIARAQNAEADNARLRILIGKVAEAISFLQIPSYADLRDRLFEAVNPPQPRADQ